MATAGRIFTCPTCGLLQVNGWLGTKTFRRWLKTVSPKLIAGTPKEIRCIAIAVTGRSRKQVLGKKWKWAVGLGPPMALISITMALPKFMSHVEWSPTDPSKTQRVSFGGRWWRTHLPRSLRRRPTKTDGTPLISSSGKIAAGTD